MKTVYALILLAAAIFLLVPDQSDAIPAFARKHGFNCNMCHVAFIKLNDFGQRFRDNGYQIPGQVGGEKTVFDTPPPLAIRTTTGFWMDDTKTGDHKTTTNTFNIFGFDLLAAGVLHENVSFMFIYTPRVDEPTAEPFGAPAYTNGPSQSGAIESANIVFSNIVPDLLSLRIGRFEPAYHGISSKRSYYIFQPYEIYGFPTVAFPYLFDDNQMGIEASGHCRCGLNYAAGLVNGTGSYPDNNKHKDFYMDLSHTFGKGAGQSAGQRVGVFSYYGWQPAAATEGMALTPTDPTKRNGTLYRIGGDASLNWKTVNLQAMFMQGLDAKELNTMKAGEDYKYSGGFVELDWAGLLNNRLVASALYNWVMPPDWQSEEEIRAYSGLVRYYMGDWTAVNVALHAEFTHRQIGKDDPDKESQFALVLDFDF